MTSAQDNPGVVDATRPPSRNSDDDPAPAPPVSPSSQDQDVPAEPRWQTLRETNQEHAACLLALALLGTSYAELPPRREAADRDCGMARPLRVTSIIPGVRLEGDAEMRCETARALGFWTRDFLRPAAAMLPGAPRLEGLQIAASYVCRARVGTNSDRPRLSEHALGNAVDISGFLFDGADPLTVEPRQDSGSIEEAFQRSARSSACLFFSTVLGPGANAAHDTHLHLDVIGRDNGWRLCQ